MKAKRFFILVNGIGVVWEDTVNGLHACRRLLMAMSLYPKSNIALYCGQTVVEEVIRS